MSVFSTFASFSPLNTALAGSSASQFIRLDRPLLAAPPVTPVQLAAALLPPAVMW
jgi:hypothetical protein